MMVAKITVLNHGTPYFFIFIIVKITATEIISNMKGTIA